LHYTFKLNPNSAKHFPLFICCEKYIIDNTKSDASTDFVLLVLFRNILYVLHYTFKLNPNSAKYFPLFICCEKYILDNTKVDASTDFVLLVLFRNISSIIFYRILAQSF
jgi:hypothetical protein